MMSMLMMMLGINGQVLDICINNIIYLLLVQYLLIYYCQLIKQEDWHTNTPTHTNLSRSMPLDKQIKCCYIKTTSTIPATAQNTHTHGKAVSKNES